MVKRLEKLNRFILPVMLLLSMVLPLLPSLPAYADPTLQDSYTHDSNEGWDNSICGINNTYNSRDRNNLEGITIVENLLLIADKTRPVIPDPVGFGVWPVATCAIIVVILLVVLWRATR